MDEEKKDTPGENAPEQPEAGAPAAATEEEVAEKDKFLEATKKVASSAEKVIGASYKMIRETVESQRFDPCAGVTILQGLLDRARTLLPAEKFESVAEWCVRYGHAGLVAGQALSVFFGLAAAIKLSNWVFFVQGIGIAVLLWILQYTAHRFLNAGDSLIESSPSRLASPAFLDCLSLLTEAAGILLFISFMLLARRTGQWSLLWAGLGVWALCDAIAYMALNPAMANIEVSEDVRAGEEAIGIMSFFVKAVVRIVPIAFGIGALLGAVGLLFGTFSLMRNGLRTAGLASLRLMILCACLPFASYVVFAFYHLAIDLMRAILVLPDNLGKTPGNKA